MNDIGLIGFGSWGKALLKIIEKNAQNIIVYSRQEHRVILKEVQSIVKNYDNIIISNDLKFICNHSDVCILSTRAQEVSNLVNEMQKESLVFSNCIVTSKGFARNGDLLCNEVQNVVQYDVGILAGPNFASEIMQDKASISTLAINNFHQFQKIFNGENFQVQHSDDIIGVQVCSIMKNIYAIGCGIIFAAFKSDNIMAAFITKAFSELMQAIEMFGGNKLTVHTAAGIGDLILTCYSKTSRNHMFGERFVSNGMISEIETVEGYSSLIMLNESLRKKLSLCNALYDLLNQEMTISDFKHTIMCN